MSRGEWALLVVALLLVGLPCAAAAFLLIKNAPGALAWLACILAGVVAMSLNFASGVLHSLMLQDVNARLPRDQQLDEYGRGAAFLLFRGTLNPEILAAHAQLYPESSRRSSYGFCFGSSLLLPLALVVALAASAEAPDVMTVLLVIVSGGIALAGLLHWWQRSP